MATELTTLATFCLFTWLTYLIGQRFRRLVWNPVDQRLATGDSPESRLAGHRRMTDAFAGQLPVASETKSKLIIELRRAGFYRPTAVNDFLAFRNISIIAAAAVTAIAAVAVGPGQDDVMLQVLAIGLALVGLGWGLPRIYLSLAGTRRAERIRRSLPYTLDMISMCLTGGMSLFDALAHVSREIDATHPDLAAELMMIRQQAEMRSLENALAQFSERLDLSEIKSMSAMITQNQKLGANVANAIRDLSDNLRRNRRHLADEQTAKASLKLLFPVVICLLPSAFLILWGPAVLELQNFFREFDVPSLTP